MVKKDMLSFIWDTGYNKNISLDLSGHISQRRESLFKIEATTEESRENRGKERGGSTDL